MIHFTSMFIPLALLVPNILFLLFKPVNTPEKKNEHVKSEQVFEIFERVGQIGMFVIPLFYKINISGVENKISLIIMALSLLLYYGCRLRYFLNQRNYSLLFKPLWIIPIPMAISPIVYMIFVSKILGSYLMLMATLLFSIGHIPLSYKSYNDFLNIKV